MNSVAVSLPDSAERRTEKLVRPEPGQQMIALAKTRQPGGGLVRRKEFPWQRLEGKHERRHPARPAPGPQLTQNLLMTPVYAVVGADGHHARARGRALQIRQVAVQEHGDRGRQEVTRAIIGAAALISEAPPTAGRTGTHTRSR